MMSSGYAPIPHFITQTPEVTGTVTDKGVPVSGVKVMITHGLNDGSCRMPARTFVTDAAGHFELKRVRKFQFFTTMGDHIFRLKLCIIKDGNTYIGYTDEGIGYPPDSLKLKCDINRDSKFVDKIRPRQTSIKMRSVRWSNNHKECSVSVIPLKEDLR